MFYQWKPIFFLLELNFFYTLGYTSLIPKVQILDLLNKILVTILIDELEYRQMTEGPNHLLLASFSSSKSGRSMNKTLVKSSFFCVLIQHIFFSSRQCKFLDKIVYVFQTILHMLGFPFYIQLQCQNVCHILYSRKKKNISVVASVTTVFIRVGTDKEESHALYNIVEIHKLVILIAPLASTTHIQLKNLSTGQKIETVKNTQT